jgi:transcriptional regulator
MYLRAAHADATIPMLRELIRNNPLGVLTTAIPSKTYAKIQSSHIPFLLDLEDETSDTELGILRAHMARMNPQSKAMIDEIQSRFPDSTEAQYLEEEVLILFTAAAQHYVTPKYYVETKPTTGKVVPTWNYAAAQVYGRAKIYFNSSSDETGAYLTKQISDLSHYAETSVMGFDGTNGKPTAWNVTDAPDSYVSLLKKNIIGVEITIDRLEGKFKMSQELAQGDRQGVIHGFEKLGSEVGLDIARIVKERGDLKDSRASAKLST